MTEPHIQDASGICGEKLTYASTNENNKEIDTFLLTHQLLDL